jgi:hypothetical protein
MGRPYPYGTNDIAKELETTKSPVYQKSIKIISFNVSARSHQAWSVLDSFDADLLLTQKDVFDTSFGNYGLVDSKGHGEQRVACYRKPSRTILVSKLKKYAQAPLNATKMSSRYGISMFVDGWKVANVFLEGGHKADALVLKEKFEDLLERKIDLLRQMVENPQDQPDIIIGCFNSVFSSDSERVTEFLSGQYTYFETVHNGGVQLTEQQRKNVDRWNLAPIEYLLSKSYSYIPINNEGLIVTNKKGSNIVDHVFLSKTAMQRASRVEVSVIPIVDSDEATGDRKTSDHNPIQLDLIWMPMD